MYASKTRCDSAPTQLARVFILLFVIENVQTHFASHDNILRVQLWDEEGLTKVPKREPSDVNKSPKLTNKVLIKEQDLISEMYDSDKSTKITRFTRRRNHRGGKGRKHRRRRIKKHLDDVGEDGDSVWKFQDNSELNVIAYDKSDELKSDGSAIYPSSRDVSEVDISVKAPEGVVNGTSTKGESGTQSLLQDQETKDDSERKTVAVVPKCCPVGQNYSAETVDGVRVCASTMLTFRPYFYETNSTHMWEYESNVFESIVGNPCPFDKYKLDPEHASADEFYLFTNGTIFAPFHSPVYLGVKNYCMESFWNESSLAGETRPLVCFKSAVSGSHTLLLYATGLLISVPLLLITALIHTWIPELRDPHGLSLACHTVCLAAAFTCLAATQLAGQSFPNYACRSMAFLIQFSFISCFFWLNVMCFDTWINVRRYLLVGSSKSSEKRRFLYYSIYAISLPLILVVVTLIMDLDPAVPSTYIKPNFGVVNCWFKTDQAALPYFYGPVACVLFANVIIFFLTSRDFAKHYHKLTHFTMTDLTSPSFGSSQDWARLNEMLDLALNGSDPAPSVVSTPQQEHHHSNFKQRWRKYKKLFQLCVILSFIMGLSWIMEVVSWAANNSAQFSVWSFFDVINSLQGLVIFCIFVLQAPVRSLVWKRIRWKFSRCCRDSEENCTTEMLSERTIIACDRNPSSKRSYV